MEYLSAFGADKSRDLSKYSPSKPADRVSLATQDASECGGGHPEILSIGRMFLRGRDAAGQGGGAGEKIP